MDRKARIAALAVMIAIPAEGLRQYAYYDPPGILTVCYGHTGEVQKGVKYSLAECKALLDADMMHAVEQVERFAPTAPEPVAAAIADAVFNIGPKIIDPARSTLARKLKAGDLRGACNELPKWNKSTIAGRLVELPGLTKRRAAEKELCLTGVNL
jgi:lysozyme